MSTAQPVLRLREQPVGFLGNLCGSASCASLHPFAIKKRYPARLKVNGIESAADQGPDD
jgi:hypothetical protein